MENRGSYLQNVNEEIASVVSKKTFGVFKQHRRLRLRTQLRPHVRAACAKHINEKYNVDRVSRAWPTTMEKLRKSKGDCIKG